MSSERDLLTQALAGHRKARVGLYERFIQKNSHLRLLAAGYPAPDEFLQDTLINVLRAGHSFRGDGLGEWVESVAAWTALEHERLSDTRSGVRMCASFEAGQSHARLASYVPPRSESDSLRSQIAAIVGESQYKLLRARAADGSSWEQAAAAAGKPVISVGSVLVRAADRLSRLFGAPPPLNDELEPVFSALAEKGAAPTGRLLSMQLDPAFYLATPEMRKIGLSIPAEVRTVTLFEAARTSAPPEEALRDHLSRCHFCSDVLRSMSRMQQALLSAEDGDFLLCPAGATLVNDPVEAQDAVDQHLAQCSLCREERLRALTSLEPEVATAEPASSPPKVRRKILWAAVAAAVLATVFIGGYRHFAARDPLSSEVTLKKEREAPPIVPSKKYLDLAQAVSLDDPKMLASVLPHDQLLFMEGLNDLKGRNLPAAKLIFAYLANGYQDPGAQFLYATCFFGENLVSDGYREMLKAEAMPPRNSYRCWATLQCALRVGDKAVAEREIGHLASDPDFGPRARGLLVKIRARN